MIRAKETGVSGSNSRAIAVREQLKNGQISNQRNTPMSMGKHSINFDQITKNNRSIAAAAKLEQAMRGDAGSKSVNKLRFAKDMQSIDSRIKLQSKFARKDSRQH